MESSAASSSATPARRGAIAVEGRNCWRRAHADRVAFLIDAEAYFSAFAAAAERAERTIMIVGWDVHSQAPLPSHGTTLGRFLDRLVARRRALRAYVLDWDFAMLYALERELLPAIQFGWRRHRRVRFALDGAHSVGASHHQKLVVIDDAIAFAGGLDLTICRWDTSAHRADDPRRRGPDGKAYGPFHDVQVAVDGAAAAALGELARERWRRATGESIAVAQGGGGVWPDALEPDVVDATVAIARTDRTDDGSLICEVEQLYLDAIAAARRWVYIENQYLSSGRIGRALAARLEEPDGPDVVLVTGRTCSGWLEELAMGALRDVLLGRLRAADHHGRLRAYYPVVPAADGVLPINLHAKVLIVDDRLARVGSANLSNRSCGLDTECDLAIESGAERLRGRLLAEHLGTTAEAVEAALAEHGSLIAAIESLNGSARRLERLEPAGTANEALVSAAMLADPERPIAAEELARRLLPDWAAEQPHRPLLRIAAALALPLLVAALWQWTPLRDWVDRAALEHYLGSVATPVLAPFWVVGVYVVGGLLVVPVSLLIVATVLAHGAGLGIPYALLGALSSAAVTYGAGRLLGRNALARTLGPRFLRLRRRIAGCGVAAMTLIRLVPIAPFSLVNAVAGASGVSFPRYMLGTVLSMAPGITVLGLLTPALTGAGPVAALSALAGVALLVVSAVGVRRLARAAGPGAAADRGGSHDVPPEGDGSSDGMATASAV